MSSRVLVPFDDSEPSRNALDYAIEEYPDAELIVLTVLDPTEVEPNGLTPSARAVGVSEADPDVEIPSDERRAGRDDSGADGPVAQVRNTLATARPAAEARDDVRTERRIGAPAREIVEYAETEDVDHIVMGSHGRSGLKRFLLGSVSELVVRRSPVPVTVVQ